jgi:hypothetical protein
MPDTDPIYEPESPASSKKMAPWLIVLLVLVGICVALPLISMCIIVILALLGPSIGNVFSNIILNI